MMKLLLDGLHYNYHKRLKLNTLIKQFHTYLSE
jgi:hypothetical protein